jgi:MFS family permease
MSATQIMTIQAAFSVSQMFFEIPSGYFSDLVGRRITLILAAVFMMSGIGIYVFSNTFWLFIIAEVVLGCAGALRSGTDSAILYDHLTMINEENRYARCEGIAEFCSRTGTSLSSIAGGLLGACCTLKFPFYVNFISAFVMMVVGFSLVEPKRSRKPNGNPLKTIMHVTRYSLSHYSLLEPILQMGILFSTGVTAIWGYFLAYQLLEIPLVWHGLLFALMQLTSAVFARNGVALNSSIERKFGSIPLFLLLGVLFIIIGNTSYIALLLPLVLVHAALWGMSTPLLLEKIQAHTTSDVRATTLSVSSMVSRVITLSIGPLFGAVIDHWSLQYAFSYMGILFLIVNAGLYLYRKNRVLEKNRKVVEIT